MLCEVASMQLGERLDFGFSVLYVQSAMYINKLSCLLYLSLHSQGQPAPPPPLQMGGPGPRGPILPPPGMFTQNNIYINDRTIVSIDNLVLCT